MAGKKPQSTFVSGSGSKSSQPGKQEKKRKEQQDREKERARKREQRRKKQESRDAKKGKDRKKKREQRIKKQKSKEQKKKLGQSSNSNSSTTPQSNNASSPQSGCPLKNVKPADPCYVYKLTITEKWPAADTSPPPPPNQADQKKVEQDIGKLQHQLQQKQDEYDREFDPTKAVKLLNEKRELHQKLLDTVKKRAMMGPGIELWKPPTDERVFTIIQKRPADMQMQIEDAEESLKPKRKKLLKKIKEWSETHTKFETAKKDLATYTKKKDEFEAKKQKARLELEGCMRDEKAKREAKEAYDRKTHSTGRWKTFKRKVRSTFGRDPKSMHEKAKKSLDKARKEYEDARKEYKKYESGQEYTKCKKEVKDSRNKLITLTVEIRGIIDGIKPIEEGILEKKNTLESDSVNIQMVAGEEKRRWKHIEPDLGSSGKVKKCNYDRTPKVTIEVDKDQKPHKGKKPVYCSKKPAPYTANKAPHPYLSVTGAKGYMGRPLITETTGGDKAEFEIWQAPQLDWPGRGPAIISMFFRVLRVLFSAWPKRRTYDVDIESCGVPSPDVNDRDTWSKDLHTAIEVFPADAYSMKIVTSPLAGYSYEKATTKQWKEERDPDTGQLLADNTGSKTEVKTSEKSGGQVLWGTFAKTETTSSTSGYDSDGNKVKQVEQTSTSTKSGLTTKTDTNTDKTAHGTTTSSSTNKTKQTDFVGREINPTPSNVPSPPSSFFPNLPIDLSFTRNDCEDQFTKNIKSALGLIIWMSREGAKWVSRINQIVPSIGWKFGWNVDILAGSLSYSQQFREHIDRRVYLYKKVSFDLTVVSGKVFIFFGAWLDLFTIEFKAGVEAYGSGSFNIKGQQEVNHPDAYFSEGERWWGPSGSFGIGVEISVVIGRPDWCKAAAAAKVGFTVAGKFYTQHPEGPHKEFDVIYEGIKPQVTFNLILVGSWTKEWEFSKQRTLCHKKWPKEDAEKLLDQQSDDMDKLRETAAKEAADTEKRARKADIEHQKKVKQMQNQP